MVRNGGTSSDNDTRNQDDDDDDHYYYYYGEAPAPPQHHHHHDSSLLQQALLSPTFCEPRSLPRIDEGEHTHHHDDDDDIDNIDDTGRSFVETSFTVRKFWTALFTATSTTRLGDPEDHSEQPPPQYPDTNHSSSSRQRRRMIRQRRPLPLSSIQRRQPQQQYHHPRTDPLLFNDDNDQHPDDGETEPPNDIDDDADNDDEVLNRCYFWSFVFPSPSRGDPDATTVGPARSTPPPIRPPTTNTIRMICAIVLFLMMTIGGMHSLIHLQGTVSTDLALLLALSNHDIHHHHQGGDDSIAEITTGSDSSRLPIIIVLGSANLHPPTNGTSSRLVCAPVSRRGTATYQQGREFVAGLEQYLTAAAADTTNDTSTLGPFRINSFYSYMTDGLEWWAREKMATPDGTSVLVTIDILECNGNDHHPFTKPQEYQQRQFLINAIEKFSAQFYRQYDGSSNSTIPLCLTVHPTGVPYLEVQLTHSIHDLTRTVLIGVLPLVILMVSILMWGSYRASLRWIWIIPFVMVIGSVAVSCLSLQYVILPYRPSSVSVFTPLVMILMSIGTSCVHIISLLSRYLEEMGEPIIMVNLNENRSSSWLAVRRMLKSSGSTMISAGCIGFVVLLTFLIGSASLLVKSLLIGILVATVTTSFVSIAIMPAILYYTPLGILIISVKSTSTNANRSVNYDNDANHSNQSDGMEFSEDRELNHHRLVESNHVLLSESFASQMLPTPRKSIWFSIARNMAHPYRAIILILIILQILLPVVFHLKRIQLSYQPMNVLSTNSKSFETYRTLEHHIGNGRLYPYQIVFDGHASNVSMTTKVGFATMHSVINEIQSRSMQQLSQGYVTDSRMATNGHNPTDLAARYSSLLLPNHHFDATQLKYDRYNGIAVVQNTIVSYDMFLAAKYCAPPTRKNRYCPFELLRMISATNERMTSNDTFATYTLAELGVDPFSSIGIEWLRQARYKINQFQQADRLHGVKVDVLGVGGLMYDSAVALKEPFPLLIYLSVATIVICLLIFFKSLVLLIRSAFTTWLTTSFSLGLAVAVYQDGILNWTRVTSLQSNTEDEGICWLVPFLACPVIFGLSVMLDLHLQSRILEFRERGFDCKSSIALGIDVVGGHSTCAGMILVLIFGVPLAVGENRMLYQWSFIVITSVIVDTLVIRTMVVPVILGSVSFIWWPRQLPPETLSLEEFNNRNPLQGDDPIGVSPSTYWEALIASSEYEPLSHNR